MIVGTILAHPILPVVLDNRLRIHQFEIALKLPKELRIKNLIVEPRPNYWTQRLDYQLAEKAIVTRAIDEINQP